MLKTIVPEGYKSKLSQYDTQAAIGILRTYFEKDLMLALNLKRVSAPLFVEPATGLNDDLNGYERAVSFDIPATNSVAQVVHSLAKWKRMALYNYNFPVGEGMYTDMNAIRRDEELDNLHSVYVDQWDWEKVIDKSDRHIKYLEATVTRIVNAICDTKEFVNMLYPALTNTLSRNVKFITSQELLDLYPDLSAKERENKITEEYKTVFLMQIGGKLSNGKPHDGRAPDYDDWSLNGDILFWNDTLKSSIEISSMGIRVSPESLDYQLHESGHDERRELTFHKKLLNGELPYTIGGGIGQSRLCMLLLEKCHCGEVQASCWDEYTKEICKKNGVTLL